MHSRLSTTLLPPPFWTRLAAWLGFLAVLSALLAPVSMLAEEVRTGKLGGLCSAGSAIAGSAVSGSGLDADAALPGAHCGWCASAPLAMPVPLPPVMARSAGFLVFSAAIPADLAASVAGLPFSRGPPAH